MKTRKVVLAGKQGQGYLPKFNYNRWHHGLIPTLLRERGFELGFVYHSPRSAGSGLYQSA